MPVRDWTIIKILTGIATKIWAASGAALLACFILYCFYSGLLAFILFMITLSGILYQAQDNLLYHPELPPHSRVFVPLPTMYSLPYETITIRSADQAQLHCFLIRHPGEKGGYVPTLIYFHGNAGNMGHRLHNSFGIYHTLQCNVLMVEYRGYGLSTGSPTEYGLYVDGRAAIDYLFTRHDIDLTQLIVFGRSLGGAVAIDIAADIEFSQKIMCCIVENTFTSIPEMAIVLLHKYISYLPLFVYKNKFLSIKKIQYFSTPCLFVSGLADTLVPPNMMAKLYANCGSLHKELLKIPGGSHNDTWTTTGYYPGLGKFLTECKESRGPLKTAPTISLNKWPQIEEV